MTIETVMPAERTFMGHTITLAQNWKFTVKGPEFDQARYEVAFQSFEAAMEEIKKRVDTTQKIKAQNIHIDVQVVDAKGKVHKLDRINRNTGDLIGPDTRYVYPDHPWVIAQLQKKTQLEGQLREVNDQLEQVAISTHRSYGKIAAEEYVGYINNFHKEYDKVAAKVGELATPVPNLVLVNNE